MSRLIRLIILIALFGGFALGVCGAMLYIVSAGQPVAWVQKQFAQFTLANRADDLNRPMLTGDTTPQRFTINPGDTPRVIAQSLVTQGLIADAGLFVDYVRANDYDRQLQAATYFLSRGQNLREITASLLDASASQIRFGFAEGTRLEQIVALIDSPDYRPYFLFSGSEFWAVAGPGAAGQIDPTLTQAWGLPPGASLEGFLFPDTYSLSPNTTAIDLRNTLLGNFQQRISQQLIADAAAQGLRLYQVVTLASIIQREALHRDEHPLIASAYRNRLRIGMKLDADPTIQYAIGFRDGTWWPRITAAEYTSVVHPYNTYLNTGFPPGPIASPGLSAIQAAVYPAESGYFFFRADCRSDGYHDFAITYEEHLANGC